MRSTWGWLALVCCAAIPAPAVADTCYDSFYADAHSDPFDTGGGRGKYEIHGCGTKRQISPASNNYVIARKKVYFRTQDSDDYPRCVGHLGFRLPGPDVPLGCLFGVTRYSIVTNHLLPLELSPAPKDFQVLAENYGVANGKVYYQQFVIPGARALPAEVPLRVLPYAEKENPMRRDSGYAVYGDQVFFEGQRVEDVDATSFQALYFSDLPPDNDTQYFARDQSRVYWRGLLLDGSDPESLKVVDRISVKDAHHLWRMKRDDIDLVVSELPEALGGEFFRTRYTSAQGTPYFRVLWRDEKLDDGRSVLRTLPTRLAEGDEFTVLPAGCPPGVETMKALPGMSCAAFRYEAITDFGRTKDQVFFRDRVVPDADAASFQPFRIAHYDSGAVMNASAMDARALYYFNGDDKTPDRMAFHGPVTGPIPDKYGNLWYWTDSEGIYDSTGSNMGDGSFGLGLCAYGGPGSARGLQVVSYDKGRDGRSYIELANERYRYVLFDTPKGGDNPGYVIDLKTGQRMTLQKPCGSAAKR